MTVTGEMFDYAINDCCIPAEEFALQFISGLVCRRMENGEVSLITGKSGIELAIEITDCSPVKPNNNFERSQEYWCGWVLSYCQWKSCRKYSEILSAVSISELLDMYCTLHETDITHVYDIIDKKIRNKYPETNLKRIRTAYGCSQSELSAMSGVSLRSIQMYEQRKKDINKSQSESLFRISKVLGCKMEDLIEK